MHWLQYTAKELLEPVWVNMVIDTGSSDGYPVGSSVEILVDRADALKHSLEGASIVIYNKAQWHDGDREYLFIRRDGNGNQLGDPKKDGVSICRLITGQEGRGARVNGNVFDCTQRNICKRRYLHDRKTD